MSQFFRFTMKRVFDTFSRQPGQLDACWFGPYTLRANDIELQKESLKSKIDHYFGKEEGGVKGTLSAN